MNKSDIATLIILVAASLWIIGFLIFLGTVFPRLILRKSGLAMVICYLFISLTAIGVVYFFFGFPSSSLYSSLFTN